MRAQTVGLTVVVLLALVISSITYAKPGQVTVRVIDVDQRGKEKRTEGATVELWLKGGELVKSAPTDAKGQAYFTGLEGKTEYVIRVIMPDGTIGAGGFTTNKGGGAGMQVVRV